MDKQALAPDDVLRVVLGSARDEVALLTADVKRVEEKLRVVRGELEHTRLVADAVEWAMARRMSEKLQRGPSRRQCAMEELRTTGLQRPVRARDVALRYSPASYNDAQREGARNTLILLVNEGFATRLSDGGYRPTPALFALPPQLDRMVGATNFVRMRQKAGARSE